MFADAIWAVPWRKTFTAVPCLKASSIRNMLFLPAYPSHVFVGFWRTQNLEMTFNRWVDLDDIRTCAESKLVLTPNGGWSEGKHWSWQQTFQEGTERRVAGSHSLAKHRRPSCVLLSWWCSEWFGDSRDGWCQKPAGWDCCGRCTFLAPVTVRQSWRPQWWCVTEGFGVGRRTPFAFLYVWSSRKAMSGWWTGP